MRTGERTGRMWRSRWAAIGAAVAVTLGAGGLVSVQADSSQSVFVAVTPQRVLDTRFDIGLTDGFTGGQSRQLDVTGNVPIVLAGNTAGSAVVVPDGATAIVANVTALRTTSTGFVSVRPGTATGAPSTSNVNIPTVGSIYPNAVTVELPTTGTSAGTVDLYYFADTAGGTTDLLLDIVGYYVEGTGTQGPQGPTGPTGPAGPAGPAGSQGDPGMSLVSAFESLATTAIGTASPPPAPTGYTDTVDLEPGSYYVGGDLTVRNGSATEATYLECRFYVDDVIENQIGSVTLPLMAGGISSVDQLAISATFEVTESGTKQLSYRCENVPGTGTPQYWYANWFVFAITESAP